MTGAVMLPAGIIAGCVSCVAFGRYIATTMCGPTRPHRITWWTITAVGALTFASYTGSGATYTLFAALTYFVGPLVVAVISIRRGVGGARTLDRVCLIGVAVAAIAWGMSRRASTALVIGIVLDFIGLVPTFRKAWHLPESEDRLAWLLSLLASAINLLAIDRWTLPVAGYPAYILLTNAAVTLACTRSRTEPDTRARGDQRRSRRT